MNGLRRRRKKGPEERIEDGLVQSGVRERERKRRCEPRTAAKRTCIRLAPRGEPRTLGELVQGRQDGADMLGPGKGIVERHTARILGDRKCAACVEDVAVGREHERRGSHARGDARVGRRVGLVDANLVIGELVGERLEIAPRIAWCAVGSDEHAVAGLPSNRTSGNGEEERQRRDGGNGRLSADDEAAAQRMRNTRVFVDREEPAVGAVLAQP